MPDVRPIESPARTLGVALAVCLACSLLVSASEVLLGPRRAEHLARERMAGLVALVEGIPGVLDELGAIEARRLEVVLVELSSGEAIDPDAPDGVGRRTEGREDRSDELAAAAAAVAADPGSYDPLAAAADPERSTALAPARDPAGLRRREDVAPAFLLRRADGGTRLIVLPVRGQGFQSLLHGYVALDGDGNTILGLVITEHGETPGTGSLITDPEWLAAWRGKRARDADGRIAVRVASGAGPDAPHAVDGISGATWSSEGVGLMLRFWLGDDGYGPFLRRLAGR